MLKIVKTETVMNPLKPSILNYFYSSPKIE
jgi:hypothetical protein